MEFSQKLELRRIESYSRTILVLPHIGGRRLSVLSRDDESSSDEPFPFFTSFLLNCAKEIFHDNEAELTR
jgi:hypothetical protein